MCVYIYMYILYIIYTSGGNTNLKMEVGIRFWAPNLGLSPQYRNMVKLLFRNKEL